MTAAPNIDKVAMRIELRIVGVRKSARQVIVVETLRKSGVWFKDRLLYLEIMQVADDFHQVDVCAFSKKTFPQIWNL